MNFGFPLPWDLKTHETFIFLTNFGDLCLKYDFLDRDPIFTQQIESKGIVFDALDVPGHLGHDGT